MNWAKRFQSRQSKPDVDAVLEEAKQALNNSRVEACLQVLARANQEFKSREERYRLVGNDDAAGNPHGIAALADVVILRSPIPPRGMREGRNLVAIGSIIRVNGQTVKTVSALVRDSPILRMVLLRRDVMSGGGSGVGGAADPVE